MWTLEQYISEFSKFMVCPNEQGGELVQARGSIFFDLVQTYPLNKIERVNM